MPIGKEISGPIRNDNPCLKCKQPKRHPGCHDKCKEYKEWKAEIERVNQNRRDYAKNREIGWEYKNRKG